MIIVTTDSIANKNIIEVKGYVKGSTIRTKNMFADIGSGLKSLVGGELESYTDMIEDARKIAIGRMVDEAEKCGANAIIGMRLQSAAVTQGAAEILAYGTAVVIE